MLRIVGRILGTFLFIVIQWTVVSTMLGAFGMPPAHLSLYSTIAFLTIGGTIYFAIGHFRQVDRKRAALANSR